MFVADFVGESVVLPVELGDGLVKLGERTFRADLSSLSPGANHYLVIRPELLRPNPDFASNDLNDLSGDIVELIFQGDSTLALVDLGSGHEIGVRVPSDRAGYRETLEIGSRIHVGLHPEDTLVVPGELVP